MHLYKTTEQIILQHQGRYYGIRESWDSLLNEPALFNALERRVKTEAPLSAELVAQRLQEQIGPPIGSQELWAAGVTYTRSRDARMEESQAGGGADFYQKVYEAERPELFFKALPHRIVGHGQQVNIRKDSTWNVPEPELTLWINAKGQIGGYTIGNDMSSRSIEGENPLYLPQAKSYDRSAALGPCLWVSPAPISLDTAIEMRILRSGQTVFSGSVFLHQMKRSFEELAAWLFRETSFPQGCYLMTGTGLVPPDSFTLAVNDLVDITISPIGRLSNRVGVRS